MLTVRKALSIEPLSQARIAAGEAGLDNQIKHVTVMEVPDLIQWLKGNDFIITSLYCIKDDLKAQVKLIQDIAKLGCAALAVKTNRFVQTIPAEMIAVADELSFTLLDIPHHITYIDIMNPLMEQLLDHTAGVLHKADIAFRWLQEIILNGQGLEAALMALEKFIDHPLVLECSTLNLYISAPEKKEPLSPLPKEACRHLHKTRHPISLNRYRKQQKIPSLVIPIICRASISSFLTVENYQENQGLPADCQAILDHGTALIATEIMKHHSIAELERQHANSFVEELIAHDFKSEEAMLERARYLGLDLNDPCLPLVFDIDRFQYNIEQQQLAEEKVQALKSRLQQALDFYLTDRLTEPFLLALRSDSLIVLTCWPADQSTVTIMNSAHQLAQDILLELKRTFPNLSFTGGIGQPYRGVRNISKSFLQAHKAIVLGRQAHGRGRIFCYHSLGIHRLLCSHSDQKELIALRDEVLGPLAVYDNEQNTDFIETLTTYFAHNEDINTTAKSLFVHPNTVRYRLERAAKILGRDLGTTDDRFQVYLALKIAGLHPFTNQDIAAIG